MNTGVVKFDALANSVRAGAQDDDFSFAVVRRQPDLGLSVWVELVRAVVVRSLCLELTCTGVDGLVHRANAQRPTQGTNAILARELRTKRSNLGVGKPEDLCLTQKLSIEDRRINEFCAEINECLKLCKEPWVNLGVLVELLNGSAQA